MPRQTALTALHSGVVAMMGILLKGQPDNVEALVLRGRSYFYMDDQSMAKRHFGEALKHDPDHKQAKAEFSKVRGLYKQKAQVSQTLFIPSTECTLCGLETVKRGR